MARRSTPQWKTDKHAFPITLRVLVPDGGFSKFGPDNDIWTWLWQNVGHSDFAETPHASSVGEAIEFHFREPQPMLAFLDRFPKLVLADGTMSVHYRSPALPFGRRELDEVCNLYSMTTAQEAMRRLFPKRPLIDRLGNLPPMPEIYPDYPAPIVRDGPEGRELVLARWGMPTPPQFLIGKKTDRGITNVRNAQSPHWRRWLGVEHRCLVPVIRFAEPFRYVGADAVTITTGNVWFSFPEDRPVFFAGIWTRWTSVRKAKDGETTDDLFAFLTTEPNAVVRPVHHKAMPVILTEPEEWETWLTAPWAEAKALQRPLADGLLVRDA